MKGIQNSSAMMKRLLHLTEDYTLDLNEGDENTILEVKKPLREDVQSWVSSWKETLQTFTKNLFLQMLQQYIEYKQNGAMDVETLEGVLLLAKEYNVESQTKELLKQHKLIQEQIIKHKNTLQEGEQGSNTENTDQDQNENNNQTTESSNGVSDEEAMKAVVQNLPVLAQNKLPELMSNIEGVQVDQMPPKEEKNITDLETLKTFLANISEEQDLIQAFNIYEDRIKDIQPKPVDEEKIAKVKNHFKIKDDYLDEIEKSWQKYMQAVNNNSDAGILLEMKNLLNAVHNFNTNGKEKIDVTNTEESQEGQDDSNSEESQKSTEEV